MGVVVMVGEREMGAASTPDHRRDGTQGSLAQGSVTLGCGTYPFQG
jgi:hypothetical protein